MTTDLAIDFDDCTASPVAAASSLTNTTAATELPALTQQRVWRSYRRVPAFVLPRPWRSWILDRGSLTQRLVDLSHGHFHVEVLALGWQRPLEDERRVLKLPIGQRAWVREVALQCHGQTVVKARSVIPLATCRGEERQLLHLGNRPLGAFLFRSRTMRRRAIEVGALHWHQQDWMMGRRSVFLLHDKPLLVSEMFLPELLDMARQHPSPSFAAGLS